MKAAVLYETNTPLVIEQFDLPDVADDQVRVRLMASGVHYAFEAIGLVPEPFKQTIVCTRRRGVTVFVGHAPDNTPVDFDAKILGPEKMVIGSLYGSCRPRLDFPRIFSLYKAGKLKLDELVTRVYPLEEVSEAFDALGRGEVARSVLDLS